MKPRIALVLLALAGISVLAEEHPAGMPADKAMAVLMEGNHRYVTHGETHPDATLERRHELAGGQHPYAVIVGCSDSRVPPELVFDAGLGDLFVIRDAGNVVDEVVLGSVEYAVQHLGVKLVLVLGHESCGAVTAAVNHAREAHITTIVEAIQPALNESKGQPGDPVHNCVLANARLAAKQIRESRPVMANAVLHGGVKVQAASYDLRTGKVSLLDKP
jgi:carbonic anhydrase